MSPNNSVYFLLFPMASLLLSVFFLVTMWKVYAKAGKPGWATLIPIYNTYVLLKIANKPGWWLILFFIPIVNLIFLFIVAASVARMFGRSVLFGVIMLTFLGFIGYPILAFGKSKYLGGDTQANQNEIPTVQPTPPQPVIQQPINQPSPIQQTPTPQPTGEVPSSEIKLN